MLNPPVHTVGSTAILLFSRSAAEEARFKSFELPGGQAGNRTLIRSLIRHSTAEAQQTGLPVLPWFEARQRGNSFGERLAHAIESAFDLGYERVITIGNDCPGMNAGLLLEAQRKLLEQDVVLGPALDGGLYLIGLHRRSWNREDFLALPWQEDHLQSAWTELHPELVWLEGQRDLNRTEDLRLYLAEAHPHNRIFRLISRLLRKSPLPQSNSSPILWAQISRSGIGLRAPPY